MYSPKSLFNSDLGFFMSILFPEIFEQGVDRACISRGGSDNSWGDFALVLWGICKLF